MFVNRLTISQKRNELWNFGRYLSASQLPKMPSNRSRLSRLGGKLFNVGFWGGIIALWCLRLGDERPLIVRAALDMEEKQERIREAVERGKKKAAEKAAEKAKKK